jgi:hypothetical protein
MSPTADREWAAALLKIKRRDPAIYDTSMRLFSDAPPPDAGTADDAGGAEHKGGRKKTLRQVLYEQVCLSRAVCTARGHMTHPRGRQLAPLPASAESCCNVPAA